MADETTLQYRHLGGRYQFDVQATGDEGACAEEWLVVQLDRLGAAGGVHQWPAPPGTVFPYLAFRYVSALPDQYNFGATGPALTPILYNVWAVDQAEAYDNLSSLAAGIKDALNVVQHDTGSGMIYRARRVLYLKDEEVFL